MENGKKLSFEVLSALWKNAGFRSNTKNPTSKGGFKVNFDDLEFKQGEEMVKVDRCVVDFDRKEIITEDGKKYGYG